MIIEWVQRALYGFVAVCLSQKNNCFVLQMSIVVFIHARVRVAVFRGLKNSRLIYFNKFT